MPKANLERNNFVRGLITEATPLRFPENASIDEDNFILNRDGSRRRRFGMDYEDSYALTSVNYTGANFEDKAVSEYTWTNAGGDADNIVGVLQVGATLYFFDLTQDAPSAATIPTISLGSAYDDSKLQFASIKGVLVAVGDAGDAFYVERVSASSYTKTDIDIKVRDIWGVEESPALAVDERPSTLSDTHEYNLKNQGWTSSNISTVGFPSNAEIMQYGKDANDNFSKSFLDKQFFGTTSAPKGKFIIDAFSRGAARRTAVSDPTSTIPDDVEAGRCTTVAAYSGRIFYAGVQSSVTSGDNRSPSFTGTIFFTRIVDNLEKLSQCYQEADPTSEHVSDLLPTDGGTIDIPEASNIHKLITLRTSLVVLADNGVWEITGPDGVFSADDFSISRVTNVGTVNADCVVEAEGVVFYWSDGGIYVLSPDETTGRLSAVNLTETSIQTFYTDIPALGRVYCKGTYDKAAKKIRWLYNDSSSYNGNSLRYKYNKELIYDAVLQAFYPHTFGELATDSPFVAGYFQTPGLLYADITENIVVDGEPVVVDGEQAVVTLPGRTSSSNQTKYLIFKPGAPYQFTLGFYKNNNFKDWVADDSVGVDAPAFLVAGYETFAETQRKKYVPYLTTHFKRTETGFSDDGNGNLTPIGESGCLLQAQWDFANSASSGKWGTAFQAYRLTRSYMPSGTGDTFDYGHSVITTKNRLRGSGRALSLKFSSEAGKDCYIYGWAMSVEGGSFV